MAKVHYLDCSGDSLFSGAVNTMTGPLYVEGGTVAGIQHIYPVGAVILGTSDLSPTVGNGNHKLNLVGTWERMGIIATIGDWPIYAYRRTK